MCAAIAARTSKVNIRPNVLLAPLYEPIKLAEDLSVVQLISNGRLQIVVGAGYRPYEFEMFGTRREDRKERYMEVFEVLRQAWTGKEFEFKGRKVTIRPQPESPPPLLLGGTHPAVARRAAHIADGFFPPDGSNWDAYRDERLKLGNRAEYGFQLRRLHDGSPPLPVSGLASVVLYEPGVGRSQAGAARE